MLTVGSFAMGACEPGQVWKEAAVSKIFHVPEGGLARAGDKSTACVTVTITGARFNSLFESIFNCLKLT